MNRHHKSFVLKILISFLFVACMEDPKNETNRMPSNKGDIEIIKKNNLNISLLLDLSDRISPTKYPNSSMEYYLRDVNYIKSISEAFDLHLRRKKVREMNDKIQLYFEPEPSNQNINSISNSLRYTIDRKNASLKLLDEVKSVYASKPQEIYELAINDDEYVGSDTWKFIKTKVDDYCIREDYRNILIIFTDGYIYHKDGIIENENQTTYITPQFLRNKNLNNGNWKEIMSAENLGFIPAHENLSNLEILVLGINPDKKNPFELDIIMKYWKDWFNTMNVKRYEIKTAELPSNLDDVIKKFILN